MKKSSRSCLPDSLSISVPAAFAIITLFLLHSFAWAQNFRGSVVGSVEDPSGARIAAATISIQQPSSGMKRTTVSNRAGEFRMDDLLPGTYQMIVTAPGFAPADAQIAVLISSARAIHVRLTPSAVLQQVQVASQSASITTEPINTTTAVHQGVITEKDLQTIPLAARSFANIAYLVPGTEPVEPSDPTKARITAVSTGGSSGLNNELSVDGGDDSDDYIGGFLQNFSPDIIQEFAVRTAGEDADTGRTTGASVVITTRRGTDIWHGTGAIYERLAALNARYPIDNPAPNPKQPFSRQNYVGAIGGPLLPKKLWIFSGLEYVHEDASIAYSTASLTQFNALAQLAAQGLVTLNGVNVPSIGVPDNVPVPFCDYLGSTRFDWFQSNRSQWYLRAAIDNYITHNALVQQAALPSTGAESHNNYLDMVMGQQYMFTPTWIGSFIFSASGLHLTEARNSNLGFALAFPFTTTSSTTSGFETFGDNQFVTPITAFPILRNQEKYPFRYDLSHSTATHAPRIGISVIHEPVMSGSLASSAETLVTFALNPVEYRNAPQQFSVDLHCTPSGGLPVTPGTTCATTPAADGSFQQNVQRLGVYAEDSWRATPRFTVNYGLRYDTTFGLLTASGRSQLENPAYLTLKTLNIPLITGAPHDYRGQIAPRLGLVYAPGHTTKSVLRAGFGLYYDDLAQNGWAPAFQAVNQAAGTCVFAGASNPLVGSSCLPSAASTGPIGTVTGSGAIIAPNYKTPYAIHITGGGERALNANWTLSVDYTHEQGNHAYRRYQYQAGYTLFSPLVAHDITSQRNIVPNVSVFRSDNRSSYNALTFHLQGNVTHRFGLVANYTLSKAQTWGCVLGELFDYVNGVCNPLQPFGKGDYGPSGEDVRHRFVLAGTFYAPGNFVLTTLTQLESARPFTLTTSTPVTGVGDGFDDRAVVNGVPTTLDQLRGTPYIQSDWRVSRPIAWRRSSIIPFIEFFNLFNRNNPGANYVTNVAALPVPQQQIQAGNITSICSDASCTSTQPITSLNQLRVPAGALGDFFGPGTTVGIPFAAQFGVRFEF